MKLKRSVSKNRPRLRAGSQFSRIEKFVGGLLSFPRTGCAPYANRKHINTSLKRLRRVFINASLTVMSLDTSAFSLLLAG